jgi:hypothetical protein
MLVGYMRVSTDGDRQVLDLRELLLVVSNQRLSFARFGQMRRRLRRRDWSSVSGMVPG